MIVIPHVSVNEGRIVHIIQLALQFNKKPSELFQTIKNEQEKHRKMLFNQLKKDNPILSDFDKLFSIRNMATGFDDDKLDNLLSIKANQIMLDKKLYSLLQKDNPQFARLLLKKSKIHNLEMCREE